MKKITLFIGLVFVGFSFSHAQTAEELKKELSSKKDLIAALQSKADLLQNKLTHFLAGEKGLLVPLAQVFRVSTIGIQEMPQMHLQEILV